MHWGTAGEARREQGSSPSPSQGTGFLHLPAVRSVMCPVYRGHKGPDKNNRWTFGPWVGGGSRYHGRHVTPAPGSAAARKQAAGGRALLSPRPGARLGLGDRTGV